MSTEGEQDTPPAPRLGLALGSGSARGWAHIGVIQALEEMGVRPDVVAGTSIGALVGSAYVNGALDDLADWVKTLTTKDVFGLMDFTLSGGVVKGEKLFGFFEERHSNPNIEDLEQRFVTVATDMKSGREIWISKGPILQAARASCALPGLFTPLKHQGRWMLDGGLVNPVPVSAARAFGADVVIAVNLNAQLVGAHLSRQKPPGRMAPPRKSTASGRRWRIISPAGTARHRVSLTSSPPASTSCRTASPAPAWRVTRRKSP